MSRKRTGLRNKYRSGRSTYSIKQKAREADRYGAFQQGRRVHDETIAGHRLDYNMLTNKKKVWED